MENTKTAITDSHPIEVVLDKLDNVQETANHQYRTRCPAHQDKNSTSRTLSIRETEGGSVLIHCFGGCDIYAVVSAVGLEISDLFPPNDYRRNLTYITHPRSKNLRQIIEQAKPSATLVQVAVAQLLDGKKLNKRDLWLLQGASECLWEVLDA